LPHETFGFIAGERIRQVQATVEAAQSTGPGELAFAAFWREYWPQIADCLAHAERLGKQLQSVPFEHVLCHADIHAANIMIATSGEIYLVDWDGPLIAPRERDLLFVVGSVIARSVLPSEEALFFETYGQVSIDQTALAYYRFERALEDLGETGAAILLDDKLSEEEKFAELPLMRSFFVPDGIIELAYRATRS
jgi:spectinomycin phosphotransferase